MQDEDYIRRAHAAWLRSGENLRITDWDVVTEDGREYVLLFGAQQSTEIPCAVYRVTNQGQLKRLKRWPASLVLPDGGR